MTFWILTGLIVFFLQATLAPIWRYLMESGIHIKTALGPRDNEPLLGKMGGRFERAFQNMKEAFPIFIALTLLAEIQGNKDPIGIQAAAAFVIARVFYIPAYVSAIPGLRTLVWLLGHGSLLVLALRVAVGPGDI